MGKYFLETQSLNDAARCLSGIGWTQAIRLFDDKGREIIEVHRQTIRGDLHKESVTVEEAIGYIAQRVSPDDLKLMREFDDNLAEAKSEPSEDLPVPGEPENDENPDVEKPVKEEPEDDGSVPAGEEEQHEKVGPSAKSNAAEFNHFVDVMNGAAKSKTAYNALTKDMMNDFAAKHLPNLEIKPTLKKRSMLTKVLKAAEELQTDPA